MDTKRVLRTAATVAWRITRAGLVAGVEAVLEAARAEPDAAVDGVERERR